MTSKLCLIIVVCCLVVSSSVIGKTVADLEYTFNNTVETSPGGIRYDTDIGEDYSLQILETASTFIWNVFQQNPSSDIKDVQLVALSINDEDQNVAYTSNGGIHVSAGYVQNYTGDVRTEITGVLYHEVTHVWQWNGNGQAPSGLIEGVADFVGLMAGFAPGHWVQPGQGVRWDQGYDVTAWFLDYCNDLGNGNFVAQLNGKMRDGYNDSFFEELLGESVGALWSDYKAKYGDLV